MRFHWAGNPGAMTTGRGAIRYEGLMNAPIPSKALTNKGHLLPPPQASTAESCTQACQPMRSAHP